VTAGRLDRRLRLTACELPLESFAPPGKRRMGKRTVGVRCNGKHAWTIYVPVSVKVMTEVIIAKRALERGTIISAADVGLEQRDISRLHRGYLEQKIYGTSELEPRC